MIHEQLKLMNKGGIDKFYTFLFTFQDCSPRREQKKNVPQD
jgi:hypothetical protein